MLNFTLFDIFVNIWFTLQCWALIVCVCVFWVFCPTGGFLNVLSQIPCLSWVFIVLDTYCWYPEICTSFNELRSPKTDPVKSQKFKFKIVEMDFDQHTGTHPQHKNMQGWKKTHVCKLLPKYKALIKLATMYKTLVWLNKASKYFIACTLYYGHIRTSHTWATT